MLRLMILLAMTVGCTTVDVTKNGDYGDFAAEPGCKLDFYFTETEIQGGFAKACDVTSHVSRLQKPTRVKALDNSLRYLCDCGAQGVILGRWSSSFLQNSYSLTGIRYASGEQAENAHAWDAVKSILACHDNEGTWANGQCT